MSGGFLIMICIVAYIAFCFALYVGLPILMHLITSRPRRRTEQQRILTEEMLRDFFGVVAERRPNSLKNIVEVQYILSVVQGAPAAQRLREKVEKVDETDELPSLLAPDTEEYREVIEDIEDVMTAYATLFNESKRSNKK